MTQLAPWFDGTVSPDGKLSLYHKDKFQSHLHSLKGPVQLKVEKLDRKRTTPQNKYYWGVIVKLIAGHTGEDTDTIHETLKLKFLGSTVHRLSADGNKMIEFQRVKSSASLDTLEFVEFTEKCRLFANEFFGLNIPLPGEVSV